MSNTETKKNEPFELDIMDKFKDKQKCPSEACSEKAKFRNLKHEVLDELIFPEIKKKIKESTDTQNRWSLGAGIFITFKYICASISIIFVFCSSSAVFSEKQAMFALIGGLLHVSSIVCEQLGKYCMATSDNVLNDKNEILSSLGINYKEPDTNFSDPLSKEDEEDVKYGEKDNNDYDKNEKGSAPFAIKIE
jgi:hypothetical protein